MHINVKRFIVFGVTILAAAAWGYESAEILGTGVTQTLLSIAGGFIIGIIGYELAGKIR